MVVEKGINNFCPFSKQMSFELIITLHYFNISWEKILYQKHLQHFCPCLAFF